MARKVSIPVHVLFPVKLIPVIHLDIVDGNAKLVLGLVSFPFHHLNACTH